MRAIGRVAQQEGVVAGGYRILANHGAAAHQEVPHFHLHLFGGRDLGPMLRRARLIVAGLATAARWSLR